MTVQQAAKSHRNERSSNTPTFSVCICSCGRPTLVDTITSVLQQQIDSGASIEIVVVDNSASGSCFEEVRGLQEKAPPNRKIQYIHDPSNNLAEIRNVSVAGSSGEFVAFIDDDEVATPNWLQELHAPIAAGQADITVGEVLSEYSETCPDWIASGKLLDKFKFKDGSELSKGHTASAMMSRQLVDQYPFDTTFGQSGDEDTDLFFRMHLDGYRIRYCKTAVVTEFNAPGKENWDYLRRSNIATGQCYASIIFPRLSPIKKIVAFASVLAKSLGFLALSVASFPSKKHRSVFMLRAVRNFTKLQWILQNRDLIKLYCVQES